MTRPNGKKREKYIRYSEWHPAVSVLYKDLPVVEKTCKTNEDKNIHFISSN